MMNRIDCAAVPTHAGGSFAKRLQHHFFVDHYFVALTIGLTTLLTSASRAAEPPSLGRIKGISWGWDGARGDYSGPAAAESMKLLAATGADWVCIAFAASMETPTTPRIRWGADSPRMVTDEEIRRAVQLARDHGLKVVLKPVVNCDDGTWRAWVNFFRPVTAEERSAGLTGIDDVWRETPRRREGETIDAAQWKTWWTQYDEYVVHYARLAAQTKCELFCLGCEMGSTESFETEWRALIAAVRKEYSGPLVYDVNHDRELEVKWWDAVDVIGVSAYYRVLPPGTLTEQEAARYTTGVAEIVAELRKARDRLAELHRQFHKPILFIETGVTSVRGCGRYPWDYRHEQTGEQVDELEQENYYQAMFEVFWDQPWFAGFCWWDWPARLYPDDWARKDRGFCIHGKRAEQVLREWYIEK